MGSLIRRGRGDWEVKPPTKTWNCKLLLPPGEYKGAIPPFTKLLWFLFIFYVFVYMCYINLLYIFICQIKDGSNCQQRTYMVYVRCNCWQLLPHSDSSHAVELFVHLKPMSSAGVVNTVKAVGCRRWSTVYRRVCSGRGVSRMRSSSTRRWRPMYPAVRRVISTSPNRSSRRWLTPSPSDEVPQLLSPFKEVKGVLWKIRQKATERHLPYGITVLPATRHRWTRFAVTLVLVIYRDGLPDHRQSPILVVTTWFRVDRESNSRSLDHKSSVLTVTPPIHQANTPLRLYNWLETATPWRAKILWICCRLWFLRTCVVQLAADLL